MIDIIELNERIFHRLEQSDLLYTFRKSNYGSRLEQGYWFYGNENQMAISFWSGMDWKNRTPNIVFVITQNGNVYLEINVSDSDRKREFITNYLADPLELGSDSRKFRKYYADNLDLDEAIFEFEKFLNSDKIIIDEIINRESKSFFLPNEESISNIDRKEFRQRLQNVHKYRRTIVDIERTESKQALEKPTKLQSFRVWDSGPISYTELTDIPADNKWIFITGENGSGKTSFLRAISTALGYRSLDRNEQMRNPNFRFEARLFNESSNITESFTREHNEGTKNRRPKVSGLCMYGPFRLLNSRKLSEAKFKLLYTKSGSFESLFSDNSPLLDIDKQLDIWKKDRKSLHLLEKRQYHIKNILTAVVPNLYNIDLSLSELGKPVEYQTRRDDISNQYSTPWENLSSGTRSVFSLILDILLRLYDQQPKVVDPAELKGVVLIDEIDLHLHPLAQKELVVNLSNVFSDVQFIVTTHSPIPLLGAPRNSMIYVMRNYDGNVSIERMDDKVMFRKILPNAIFTSPIFGFSDLVPDAKGKDEIPYLDDDFNQVKRRENLNRDIREYLNNDKQKELLALFNKEKQ
ncbi:AAA family ATPase [Dyadobacter fermentans]|uniref:SMC domain protein n=1 Tax=Dyadobacter fermentans (strain ATCC 700827 / DSM 18053 / CIP 107007 / KCTC 52180 / NS114) TaxID=471854 RepID=C6W377_DYAFD|nr:AAA family ATPase [Dyadobacter fermentans]ACT92181.1 SMC domain protein [Dyadobacter fermentans DSM 18053]